MTSTSSTPPPVRKPRISRDFLLIVAPAILMVIGAFSATLVLMRPAPPNEIVMATGLGDGNYHAYGVRYRDFLEREGVTVVLQASSGAVDNFRRLTDPESNVDVAFVQGGIARGDKVQGAISLGSLYYEPLWVFHRGERRIPGLGAFRGKMIAIGADKSGTAALAMTLLESYGLARPPTTVLKIGGRAAANLLMSGGIDGAFFIADIRSPIVQELMHAKGIQLVSLERADAYVRQHYFLTKLVLPQGVIDLERNIPDADIVLVAPTANLLARKDLHPAITYLLLRAASEIHGQPSIFSGLRQFPAPSDTEVPLSPEAARYYKSGTPLLQRYLPFWLANLADRLLLLLVPALAVLFPLVRALPAVYRWRVRSRIYRWYARLKEIELELDEKRSAEQLRSLLERLDAIEDAVNHIDTPLAYSENLYQFRQHINLVRERAQSRLQRRAPYEDGAARSDPLETESRDPASTRA